MGRHYSNGGDFNAGCPRLDGELSKPRQFLIADLTCPVSFSRGNVAENVVLIVAARFFLPFGSP
jgi:hypothetical protein